VSTTQAQAAVMERTAARFEQVNDVLQATLTRLMTQLEVLRTRWQGAGGRAFEQARQAWAADQAALQRALLQTAASIRAAARGYRASDAEAAVRVARSAPPPLELPL
jgi:WXG100 family type VII secretion target